MIYALFYYKAKKEEGFLTVTCDDERERPYVQGYLEQQHTDLVTCCGAIENDIVKAWDCDDLVKAPKGWLVCGRSVM